MRIKRGVNAVKKRRKILKLAKGYFGGRSKRYRVAREAVMKAQTAAIKYAFMLSLCIATGDDPEADTGTDEVTSEKVNPARPPKATSNTKTCADCGEIIADARVISFSNNRYGRVLCRDCQKLANKAA